MNIIPYKSCYFKLYSAIHLPLIEEGDFLLNIVKMYDSFYEQYNYLEILAFNQKNDKLNVKIRNVDDGYVQDFTFDNFKNFENWFRKYAI